MSRIHHIVEVEVIGRAKLRVTFDDGEMREIDMSDDLWGPVFEPLRDPDRFAEVRVEGGSIEWPTGADLDPVVIYDCLPTLKVRRVTRAAS
jgi:hypothetical protein